MAKNTQTRALVTAPVTAPRRTMREDWKTQERRTEVAVNARRETVIDERAHARATDGERWTARKTH